MSRIAIDARELLGQPTGAGRYLAELLRAWDRRPDAAAHEFVLCAPAPPPIATARLRVTTRIAPGDGTWWEQRVLPRLVREARADVLFSPAYTAPILPGAPFVVAMHDVSFAAHPAWFRWREGLRRRLLARLAARRAARVLTLSRFSQGEIVRHLGVAPARVEVIYPGTTRIAPPPPPGRHARDPLVLYVGSIFNRRHLPVLVEGVAQLARRIPDVRLDVVGDNRTTPHEDLEALARRLQAPVRVRAYVSDAELADLYARAAAFAFLSSYEGFGLTPLEALAAGVPLVVLDTPVAREVYGPAALYVADLDPARIADALGEALQHGTTRTRLLDTAPAVLARYSWDRCAARTLEVLLEAAAGPAAPAAGGR